MKTHTERHAHTDDIEEDESVGEGRETRRSAQIREIYRARDRAPDKCFALLANPGSLRLTAC